MTTRRSPASTASRSARSDASSMALALPVSQWIVARGSSARATPASSPSASDRAMVSSTPVRSSSIVMPCGSVRKRSQICPSSARSSNARSFAALAASDSSASTRPDRSMSPAWSRLSCSAINVSSRSGSSAGRSRAARRRRPTDAAMSPRAAALRPATASRAPARPDNARAWSSAGPNSIRYRCACSRWYPRISSYSSTRVPAHVWSQPANRSCRSDRSCLGIASYAASRMRMCRNR